MRVLLVEDEKTLSAAICKYLKRDNIVVDPAYNGIDGLDNAMAGIYDAVILDVMLPGLDGFSILRELRASGSSVPVMMLTARGGLEDRINGLEAGADYYLPKPFQMAELLACLHAITRRKDETKQMELSFGDVALIQQTGMLHCSSTGKEIKLGAKEYQLLEVFLRNPRQILSREILTDRVWGYDSEAEYNNLEVYISFVRKKMTFVGSSVRIRTTRGLGYSMEEGT